jgi:hypothetical protein
MAEIEPQVLHLSGKCRVCGCTVDRPCLDETGLPCSWIDAEHTLCDNLDCIARVPMSELEKMVPA